ncbi:YeiH family protein [Fodinicurvata sediminis]|uniref:YeiH family protein n=1 Tax=Fodinicurvata sediminis TaxID=1121832 RepID=UPI0003F783BC|nr:putative sulfate exporter family transporter [Fodinicurvata sediminis]
MKRTKDAARKLSDWFQALPELLPGLLFSILIAMAAHFITDHYGGPTILFALLLGMAFNFVSAEPRFAPGVGFTAKQILRIGVALLGARITVEQILALGGEVMLAVAAAVVLTIGFGFLAARTLGLNSRFGILSAGSVAICGASAAAAISSVLPNYKSKERDTVFTIIGVTTLSTAAMILYPVIAGLFNFDDTQTGVFLGGTIHDVAQVVGAGYSVSDEAGDTATIIKLLRVALLVPVVLTISLAARRISDGSGGGKAGNLLPGFLIAFLLIVGANSLTLIPESVQNVLSEASRWCIITAIAALGVKTSLVEMVKVGGRAIGMIVAETVFIASIVIAALMTI